MRNNTFTVVEVKEVRAAKRRCYLKRWGINSNGSMWATLNGVVYGHRKFADGTVITTSPIIKLDIPGGTAETLNTLYTLEDTRP